ncbi:hypothetical protein Ahy_A06g029057 [Arachis hypogaea]|uniref:Uncharacterized protein n=1 Tax=Arachis hypogaea TaxID=3818 RepID=A0A445CSC2_ARAHY|nr:hypothetical protein Ahy_A06g029057 [Arachis hypogaea]
MVHRSTTDITGCTHLLYLGYTRSFLSDFHLSNRFTCTLWLRGNCLGTDHPLGPATDHRLGKLLPHQLANQTRAPPRADSSFCSSAYGSATGNTTSRPTCMCKACRQRSS